ncbi:MAG: hypothetical protein EOP54_03825 [Sphingobacteriales bacterium]|nr:MAG: hypothetical protein EOP54_03825 [Sphingobacteriales bacterium]
MNQNEAAAAISTAIPEVTEAITKDGAFKNPFALIHIITQHTRKMVVQHNELMTEKCLKLVDRIYTKGDLAIKNAIENVFIFSLDNILFSCSAAERNRVFSKVPINLYTSYINQVYKSGI